MQTTKRYQFLVILLLLISSSVLAQPAENPQTFCNPLNLNYRFMFDAIDAREAADAVIVLFQDDYYLFASRSGGYWTSPDLRTWTLIVPTGLDIEGYAPAVVAMRDTLFYVPSNSSQIYKTGDPKSGIWQQGPTMNIYGDPAFYLDDDGRLYMCYGLSNSAPTGIVELNPYTFQEISSRVTVVYNQSSVHGWERRGDDNLLDESPWIEGTWMIKENGKYYYHYAAPGTEWKTYADGIYVADSPLGPFEYATYSPFSFKPTGFICGAGHGNTFKDKDDKYWHIGTMTISIKHMFERRLGIAPVAFDEDGHIHSNTAWGDYPQYFPGVKDNHIDENFTGMMLLSHKKYVMASSSLEDHGIELAVDEEVRTYWSALTGDPGEWLMIDLGKECSIEAIQVNFAEDNTNPDIVRGRDNLIYQQYNIEKSSDGMSWDMLVDKSQNLQDVPHDYIELDQPVTARYVKLTNVFTPGEGNFAVRDLRIFGNTDQAVFTSVDGFTVDRDPTDGRDAVIRWSPVENADGYIIRYGIDPDKLYNNYMVYDMDSVAIHSLNHGVDYYFDVEAFDNGTDYYLPTGEFQSFQSGDWNDVNTWARHDGTEWINPAPNVPSLSDGPITILDGHTVTVTATDSADQLTIASGGILVIDKGVSFLVKNGIETDFTVEGIVKNQGSLISETLASLNFVYGGIYAHEQDGGTIPTAMWRIGSTCMIDSVKGTVPSNGNQNFYNVLWNCPDQEGNLSMKWNGNTIGGDITIQNTGTGRWQMCAPSTGTAAVVNINGDIIQSGGEFSSNGTGNANTTITINHYGNIDITGGNFSISRGSQGGTGTTTWNLHGNVSLANATTQNSNSGGAKFVFTQDGGSQTLTLSGVTYGEGGFPVEVDSGATLDIGTSILEGNGSFNLKAGGTLFTGHINGLDASIANTGSKIFEEGASFGFNGSEAQVTGNLMPDTVNNFIINNSLGITLSNSVVVNGILEIENGAISLDNNMLSYGIEGSLKYSGQSTQTTTDVEFPSSGGPKNLIIANSRSVILHASRTIGNLDLSGKLELGTNTLTANSTSNAGIRAYVVTTDGGVLKLKSIGASQILFPVGTRGYAPVWIMNSGTVDTISVGVISDTEAPPYGGRVRVKWNISEDTAGGGDYTIQFGWTASLENTTFRADREGNARIFNLTDTTEAGTGDYTMQFTTQPYTISRAGITNLGPFAVGMFRDLTGLTEPSKGIPNSYKLHQNYPNPFNPITIIRFEVPNKSFVNLKVYNLLGEEIVDLTGKEFSAGVHSVIFDASHLASGIYFYTLRVKDLIHTKKMVIIK